MILLIILGFVYHIYVKHQLAKLDYSNNPGKKSILLILKKTRPKVVHGNGRRDFQTLSFRESF